MGMSMHDYVTGMKKRAREKYEKKAEGAHRHSESRAVSEISANTGVSGLRFSAVHDGHWI